MDEEIDRKMACIEWRALDGPESVVTGPPQSDVSRN